MAMVMVVQGWQRVCSSMNLTLLECLHDGVRARFGRHRECIDNVLKLARLETRVCRVNHPRCLLEGLLLVHTTTTIHTQGERVR